MLVHNNIGGVLVEGLRRHCGLPKLLEMGAILTRCTWLSCQIISLWLIFFPVLVAICELVPTLHYRIILLCILPSPTSYELFAAAFENQLIPGSKNTIQLERVSSVSGCLDP